MKIIKTLPLLFLVLTQSLYSQNIDYQSRISSFYGSNCGNDPGFSTTEEHTWHGYLSDNFDLAETYSGCIERNNNGAVTQTGPYAIRNRFNVTATQFISRIDAYEDDMGSRCTYNTGFNSDDCRAAQTCTYNITNPLEYQWTSLTPTCGSNDYNMTMLYEYKYATVSIPEAVDNFTETFTTGGTRPFWGSRGAWSYTGNDCATSGTISHNETSSFSTTVSCKSQVTFRWRVSSEANYDVLEVLLNGNVVNSISGTVGWTTLTLNLDYGNNTVEWRYRKDGSGSSGEDRGYVDEIQFTNATSLVAGTITGNQTICSGGTPTILSSTAPAQIYSNTPIYQWEVSTNGITWTSISGASGLDYTPPAGATQVLYYRRRIQDDCANTGYSNNVTVTIDVPSTAPSIATISGTVCPNTTTTLTASGGVAGSGSAIYWYTGPNGTGTFLGTGNSMNVSPSATTTYYARRQGTCNTSADASTVVNVKSYVYALNGISTSTYCTDNAGWHHFYVGDEIILSVEGNLSGVSTATATIYNNSSYYQSPNLPTNCAGNINPGEESFEMSRSWNLDLNGGATAGTYKVRFYHLPSERTEIENAAIAWMSSNPACGYFYKYGTPNGFYWFKNTNANYVAPEYDGLHLASSNGTTANGVNYGELTGITSFSGGSGAVVLQPIIILPVGLNFFHVTCSDVNNAVNITWETGSEQNSSHFVIERSVDLIDWRAIHQVSAAGNSTSNLTYAFQDTDVRASDKFYYRLIQVDVSGVTTESEIVSTQCEASEAGFTMFPNPTEGELTLNIFGVNSGNPVDVMIVNLNGQIIAEFNNATAKSNLVNLELSDLSAGCYIVQIKQQNQLIQSKRFIKK